MPHGGPADHGDGTGLPRHAGDCCAFAAPALTAPGGWHDSTKDIVQSFYRSGGHAGCTPRHYWQGAAAPRIPP